MTATRIGRRLIIARRGKREEGREKRKMEEGKKARACNTYPC